LPSSHGSARAGAGPRGGRSRRPEAARRGPLLAAEPVPGQPHPCGSIDQPVIGGAVGRRFLPHDRSRSPSARRGAPWSQGPSWVLGLTTRERIASTVGLEYLEGDDAGGGASGR
jgi:hypothetical protein